MIYCEKRMKLRAEFVVFDDFDIYFFLLEVSHRDPHVTPRDLLLIRRDLCMFYQKIYPTILIFADFAFLTLMTQQN